MSTCIWLAALLCMPGTQIVQAAARDGFVEITQAVGVSENIPGYWAPFGGVTAFSVPSLSYSLSRAVYLDSQSAQDWSLSNCYSERCSAGSVSASLLMRQMFDSVHSAASSAKTEFSTTTKGEKRPVSGFDIGLMTVFGAGLLGSQLRRKQKSLRHSSLFPV